MLAASVGSSSVVPNGNLGPDASLWVHRQSTPISLQLQAGDGQPVSDASIHSLTCPRKPRDTSWTRNSFICRLHP